MLARRLGLFSKRIPQSQPSGSTTTLSKERNKSWGRKVVSFALVAVSGGVALSALDDLVIYHGCSRLYLKADNIVLGAHEDVTNSIRTNIQSEVWPTRISGLEGEEIVTARYVKVKAMEKASTNQAVVDSIGEPLVKGPWYNATLAVAHKRQSVSCTFPVSGPQGTGILRLKAVRNGEDTWFSFFRPLDWDVLVMDALLHIPANEGKQQTMRVNISDFPSTSTSCRDCKIQESDSSEKK